MNRKRFFIGLTLAVAAVLIVLSGCDTSIPGLTPGYGAVTLAIQGTVPAAAAPAAAVIATRAAGDALVTPVVDVAGLESGTLTITDARISLKKIKIEQDEDEVDTEEEAAQSADVQFEGPYVVDLVLDTVTPALPQIELLPGTYGNIQLDLDKIEGDEVDEDGTTPLVENVDPLFGHSIYLAGTYTGATAAGAVTDLPFTMTFDLDEEFSLAGANSTGLLVEGAQWNPIIIAFRLAKWFEFNNTETNSDAVIDFSSLVATATPDVALDETSTGDNATIREIIKANIEMSADYGEDSDGSGSLESDEDDDPDTEDGNDS